MKKNNWPSHWFIFMKPCFRFSCVVFLSISKTLLSYHLRQIVYRRWEVQFGLGVRALNSNRRWLRCQTPARWLTEIISDGYSGVLLCSLGQVTLLATANARPASISVCKTADTTWQMPGTTRTSSVIVLLLQGSFSFQVFATSYLLDGMAVCDRSGGLGEFHSGWVIASLVAILSATLNFRFITATHRIISYLKETNETIPEMVIRSFVTLYPCCV